MEWIKIAAICEKTGSLPSCGGLFDQDPRHVERLNIVYAKIGEREMAEINKNKTNG